MVYFRNNNVYIEDDGLFSPGKTFDCGQCFRFEPDETGYSGVAYGKKLKVSVRDGYIVLENVCESEYEAIWKKFLDLDRDYDAINATLAKDVVVAKAEETAKGIRILRQEKWETLCSFIISQNNNIPRIKKIIRLLCENFGDDIGGAFTFPNADKIAKAGVDALSVIRSGFRAKYIYDAAVKVSDGVIDLGAIDGMDYEAAKRCLMQIKGVGNKVADCVLLFAYGAFEAFPKDVWIKRVIEKYYGDSFDEAVFAPYGGIAQQYLFYYERSLDQARV